MYTYNNLRRFSTYDRDNDESSVSCIVHADLGAWWIGECDGAQDLNNKDFSTKSNMMIQRH